MFLFKQRQQPKQQHQQQVVQQRQQQLRRQPQQRLVQLVSWCEIFLFTFHPKSFLASSTTTSTTTTETTTCKSLK